MEEIWKSIPDYPNYAISSLGRVKSLKRTIVNINGKVLAYKEKLLRPRPNTAGYLTFEVRANKIRTVVRLHRILYITFVRSLTPEEFVDHINGIRDDNRLENLRIVTTSQNSFNKKNVRGYHWSKEKNKWCTQITVNYVTKHIGYFKTEKEARMAYVQGVIKYHEGFHEAKITKEEIKEAMAS